ncbi:AcrR family transcriptional regulator [Nocardia transvalensis]|uniref:AcrR family transcriptional regulator n=1 Tax=Nocardia transvalensis TaxID=37333 RepID=A0A7W9P9L7_9NOCA|nr:TetR/AcrR family transcriptional regulator [Nocardia transvalensis]MBB5911945.1 AcrR family transcriptional regulator [Nocardia transvalensis]
MPSLTRTPKRDQARRDERREAVELRVLRALDTLLAAGTPFTELAVQRISSEAGIARSTFYRYFPDKSRLLIRMAELATADQFRAAEDWWSQSHADGEAGVVAAMRAMIAGSRNHHMLMRALLEAAAYDPDVGTYWQGRMEGFVGLVRARLERDAASGHVDPTLDLTSIAIVLTCMVERSIDFLLTTTTPIDDEQMARSLGRAIWSTVNSGAPVPADSP